MILIADSGSTKTHWCLRAGNGQTSEFYTEGINPFYQSIEEIAQNISDGLLPQIAHLMWVGPITHLYFYGAGCALPEKKQMVSDAVRRSLKRTEVLVESDLLGAARGLFGNNKGIACILGTGSNSCYYNGEQIVQNISPLGFILGDEGSGAAIGRQLVADLLKDQLPKGLKERFLERFDTTPAEILENVYKRPFPNRYLASLSIFAIENLNEITIYDLVYKAFDSFVVRNLFHYKELVPVGCVGSIAFYYREVLHDVLRDRGMELQEIIQSPMSGLIKYHTHVR